MAQSKISIGETERQDKYTLYWTLPSFKKLCDTAKSQQKTRIAEQKFSVGGKNWGFHLEQKDERNVGIYVRFYGPDSTTYDAVGYAGYLKSSEGEFIGALNVGAKDVSPLEDGLGCSPSWWWWKPLSELQSQGFLPDGTLQIKFIVKVYCRNEHLRDLSDVVGDGDVKFVFMDQGTQTVIGEIKAHREILSRQSFVFATMFGGSGATGGEIKITISDMTPKAMKILINFIYSGEVKEEWASVAQELFYGADKYNLAAFREYLIANVEQGKQ